MMEKIREGESQTREDARVRKGRKVATHSVFPMFCSSGRSKSRATGAEPAGLMKDETCTALWRKAHMEVKRLKTPGVRTTFCRLQAHWKSQKCTPLWRAA